MPLHPRHVLLLALASSATACSTGDEPVAAVELRESAAPLEEQRAGSLLVEYNPTQSNGVSVVAQFLEVRGVSVETAFEALDAWSPDPELDFDACSLRAASDSDDARGVRLRMMDVGPIAVSALDHDIRLEGRWVPDLDSFSGVVYGNEEGFDFDEAFLPYEAEAIYQIAAPGGTEAGGFDVALQAPTVPEIATISGQYRVDDAPIALEGGELVLEWGAELGASTALYLDVRAGDRRLQCRVEDDGSFIVPAQILEPFAADRPLQLRLRRVDAIELPLDGVDQGTFVFAATDEATILR